MYETSWTVVQDQGNEKVKHIAFKGQLLKRLLSMCANVSEMEYSLALLFTRGKLAAATLSTTCSFSGCTAVQT